MSAVDLGLEQAINEAENEVLSLFGVAPAQVASAPSGGASGTLPSSANVISTVYTDLTNAILMGFGYAPEPYYESSSELQWEVTATNFLAVAVQQLQQLAETVTAGAVGAANYADNAAKFYATLAQNAAEAYAASLVGGGNSTLTSANDYTDAKFAQAESDIATVQADYVKADTDIQNNLAGVINSTATNLSDQIGQTNTNLSNDIAAVQAGYVKADADVTNNLTGVINGVQTDLGNQIAGVQSDLGAQIADITTTMPGLISTAVASATTGLATQLQTQLSTALDPIQSEISTCLDPMCDTVAPNAKQLGNLGSLMTALEGAGIAALLAALAYEAVSNPQAAATDMYDGTSWAVDLADQLVAAI